MSRRLLFVMEQAVYGRKTNYASRASMRDGKEKENQRRHGVVPNIPCDEGTCVLEHGRMRARNPHLPVWVFGRL